MHYPQEQWEAGRGVRLSPIHDRTAAAGALFGSVGLAGWERPLHFPLPTPPLPPPAARPVGYQERATLYRLQ